MVQEDQTKFAGFHERHLQIDYIKGPAFNSILTKYRSFLAKGIHQRL